MAGRDSGHRAYPTGSGREPVHAAGGPTDKASDDDRDRDADTGGSSEGGGSPLPALTPESGPSHSASDSTNGSHARRGSPVSGSVSGSSAPSVSLTSGAKPRVPTDLDDPRVKKNRIFVRAPRGLAMSDVGAYFSEFGEVIDVYRPVEFKSRRPRGVVYVSFAERSAVERVLERPVHTIDAYECEVSPARSKEEMAKSNSTSGTGARVIVKGLPEGVTREDVEAVFASFGELQDVYIPVDR